MRPRFNPQKGQTDGQPRSNSAKRPSRGDNQEIVDARLIFEKKVDILAERRELEEWLQGSVEWCWVWVLLGRSHQWERKGLKVQEGEENVAGGAGRGKVPG